MTINIEVCCIQHGLRTVVEKDGTLYCVGKKVLQLGGDYPSGTVISFTHRRGWIRELIPHNPRVYSIQALND